MSERMMSLKWVRWLAVAAIGIVAGTGGADEAAKKEQAPKVHLELAVVVNSNPTVLSYTVRNDGPSDYDIRHGSGGYLVVTRSDGLVRSFEATACWQRVVLKPSESFTGRMPEDVVTMITKGALSKKLGVYRLRWRIHDVYSNELIFLWDKKTNPEEMTLAEIEQALADLPKKKQLTKGEQRRRWELELFAKRYREEGDLTQILEPKK